MSRNYAGRFEATLQTEQISDWKTTQLTIDHDTGIVHNVALAGRHSRNGYQYTEEALKKAVEIYNGKPVFLDHSAKPSAPRLRSTRDFVGTIVNSRYSDNRIRSDIQTLKTEAGRTFLSLAESKSSTLGMSHVVLAERSDNGLQVEKIHDVISVDAVVFPATAATFQESWSFEEPFPGSFESILIALDNSLPEHVRTLLNQNENGEFKQPVEEKELHVERVAVYPGLLLLKAIHSNSSAEQHYQLDWNLTETGVALSDALQTLTEEQMRSGAWQKRLQGSKSLFANSSSFLPMDQRVLPLQPSESLVRERDELQRQIEVQQDIEMELRSSRLPDYAITEEFRMLLKQQQTAGERSQLIQEREALVNLAEQQFANRHPISHERIKVSQSLTDQDIASLIRAA